MKNMNKLIVFFIWFVIITAFSIITTIVYWMAYPYKILSFNDGNGTFIDKTVKADDFLQMRQESCKYKDIVSNINRQFVDGFIHQLTPTNNNRPLGCSSSIEYVYVPKSLAPGDYHLRTVISFEVNPIRTISYTVVTEKFTVIK